MIDTIPGGNVYPWLNQGGSASLGMRMGGMSAAPGSPAKEDVASAPGPDEAYTLGGSTSLFGAALVFVALLVALMFIGRALDGEAEFKNIKVSFYNALVIGLSAAVTLPIFKFLATKQPIGAIKNWIMAA